MIANMYLFWVVTFSKESVALMPLDVDGYRFLVARRDSGGCFKMLHDFSTFRHLLETSVRLQS